MKTYAYKKQHIQSGYYKKLSDAILKFQQVLLFGPTEAKNELLNLLKPIIFLKT